MLVLKACTNMLFCCLLWFVYILKRLPFFSACGLTCGSQDNFVESLLLFSYYIGSRCLILVLGLHAVCFTHWAISGLAISICLFAHICNIFGVRWGWVHSLLFSLRKPWAHNLCTFSECWDYRCATLSSDSFIFQNQIRGTKFSISKRKK